VVLRRRGSAALVTGLALTRLLEVAWSTRNLRRAGPGRTAAPRSFPLMVAVNVSLFAVCLTPRRRPSQPAVQTAALAGLAAATLLRLWTIRSLGASWNVRAVVPERMPVVTRGPYRWVRHPNYAAVALEFACLPLAVGAYREAMLLSAANALVLVPRIRGEEALLDSIPGYREAFAGVPRFIPRRLLP